MPKAVAWLLVPPYPKPLTPTLAERRLAKGQESHVADSPTCALRLLPKQMLGNGFRLSGPWLASRTEQTPWQGAVTAITSDKTVRWLAARTKVRPMDVNKTVANQQGSDLGPIRMRESEHVIEAFTALLMAYRKNKSGIQQSGSSQLGQLHASLL